MKKTIHKKVICFRGIVQGEKVLTYKALCGHWDVRTLNYNYYWKNVTCTQCLKMSKRIK